MLLTTIGEGYKIAFSLPGVVPEFTIDSNSFTSLSNDVTINYFEPGSNNPEQLPIYDISKDGQPVGYSAKTYYSLETSPEVPMTIYPTTRENHVTATRTIKFPKEIDSNEVVPIGTPKTIESDSENNENIYLMTSPSISVLGGHETSIFSINAKGDLQGVSLRSFTEIPPSNPSNIALDVNELLDNSIEWKIPDGESSSILNYLGVKLENGDYILPIINSNYFTGKLEIEYKQNSGARQDWSANTYYKKDLTSGNFILTLSEPGDWNDHYTDYYTRKYNHTMSASVIIDGVILDDYYGKKNIVYYKFSINDNDPTSTHRISIGVACFEESPGTGIYKGGTLYIKPLVKYSLNSNLTSLPSDPSDPNELLIHLKKLDGDEDFNLTYDVPDEVKILNPIDANSFNDPNHIYNKFTLCEAVIKEDDTVSSVIMINKK